MIRFLSCQVGCSLAHINHVEKLDEGPLIDAISVRQRNRLYAGLPRKGPQRVSYLFSEG